jgi:hypothetical protein
MRREDEAWERLCERRAYVAVRSMLDGHPRLRPYRSRTYGEWIAPMAVIATAYALAGKEGAGVICEGLVQADAQLADLLGEDGEEQAAQPLEATEEGFAGGQARGQERGQARDQERGCERVYDVLPVGLSLLTGRPGVGTTWLALQWALAVARAGAAYGSTRGVTYLKYDTSGDELRRRLELLNAQDLAIRIEDKPLRLDINGLVDLGPKLIQNNLVVVDTLAAAVALDGKARAAKAGDNQAGDNQAGDTKAGDNQAGDTKAGDAKAGDALGVAELLGRLHVLAMAARCAVLLVDQHVYPPTPGEAHDEIDDGLFAADADWQIENVFCLSRAEGEAGAVLTSPDSPQPLVLIRHPDLWPQPWSL